MGHSNWALADNVILIMANIGRTILPYAMVMLAISASPVHGAAEQPPPAFLYICIDGRTVTARYPNQVTAVIGLEGRSYDLSIARSADGARYIGHGWQWWTRGMHDAALARLGPGETIATAPPTACHARRR